MNAAAAVNKSDAHGLEQRRLVIVVADDEPDTVLTLRALLQDEGHAVFPAYKGDDVMPLVRKVRPDAVILDIAMPGQSGFSIAQDIHANYYGKSKPLLIAITGEYKSASDRLLAYVVGFDHHLTKPADPRKLIRLLQNLTRPAQDPPE